jgi:hypothetical protein
LGRVGSSTEIGSSVGSLTGVGSSVGGSGCGITGSGMIGEMGGSDGTVMNVEYKTGGGVGKV